MKVYIVNRMVSGNLITKAFATKDLADKYVNELFQEYVGNSCKGDFCVYSSELKIEGRINHLWEFCKEEALFKLTEVFSVPDDKVKEIWDDVTEIIRDLIIDNDDLYEEMDDKIDKYLVGKKII